MMKPFAVLATALLATFASATHEAGGPTSEVDACLAIFNAKRAELGVDPLTVHPALVDEGKRHLWEEKKFHYFGDYTPEGGNLSVRACQDPAVEPGYPCHATTYIAGLEDHTVTGWVLGVGAKGSREARVMCKVWLDPRYPDWQAITNPQFVHVGIAKSGDMWATFLGWPES